MSGFLAGSSGGSSSSTDEITDGVGSLGFNGTGALSGSGITNITLPGPMLNFAQDPGADVTVGNTSCLWTQTTAQTAIGPGPNGGPHIVFDESASSFRERLFGSNGVLAVTRLAQEAACSETYVGTYSIAAGGAVSIRGAGTIALWPSTNAPAVLYSLDQSSYVAVSNSVTNVTSNGIVTCLGSTSVVLTSPAVSLGASTTGARNDFDVLTTSARRRAYGTANTLGLTETVNATGATILAAGTLTIGGAGLTQMQPTTNVNCSITAQDSSAYIYVNNGSANVVSSVNFYATAPFISIGTSTSGAREEIDTSTTFFRRRVYGTANTLGLTETINATAVLMEAPGTLILRGAGNTWLYPSNNAASAALCSADGNSFAVATFNSVVLGSDAVIALNAPSVSFAGANPVRLLNGIVRHVFHRPAGIAVSTATTTTADAFSPIAEPATYDVKVSLFDRTAGEASIWSFEISALLFGGNAVLQTTPAPPNGLIPTSVIGTPIAATLTVDTLGTTVRVRVTTTDTTAQELWIATYERH